MENKLSIFIFLGNDVYGLKVLSEVKSKPPSTIFIFLILPIVLLSAFNIHPLPLKELTEVIAGNE